MLLTHRNKRPRTGECGSPRALKLCRAEERPDECGWDVPERGAADRRVVSALVQVAVRTHGPVRGALRLVSREVRRRTDDAVWTTRTRLRYIRQVVRKAAENPGVRLRALYVPKPFQRSVPPPRRLARRPPYPQPTRWVASVMTVTADLSTPVDMRSVFQCLEVLDFGDLTLDEVRRLAEQRARVGCRRKLPRWNAANQKCVRQQCHCLDALVPAVMDVHHKSLCRGDAAFAEVKAQKSDTSFDNQCTMRVFLNRLPDETIQKNGQLWNIVNLKIFRNGAVQMTGCKSMEQARRVMRLLIEKLTAKAVAMRNKRDCMTQLRCYALGCSRPSEIIREVITASRTEADGEPRLEHAVLARVLRDPTYLRQVLLHVPNDALFACRRTSRAFRDAVESCAFWVAKTERELQAVVQRDARRGWYMSAKYNRRFQRMEPRPPQYFAHAKDLYQRHSNAKLRRHRPYLIVEHYEELYITGEQIAMMNTDFSANFAIQRGRLYKILRQQYGLQVAYTPGDYVGVNVTYPSPVPLDPSRPDDVTHVSFFVFRTGSVIINSARTLAQQEDAYQFINGVLRKHYDEVWAPS